MVNLGASIYLFALVFAGTANVLVLCIENNEMCKMDTVSESLGSTGIIVNQGYPLSSPDRHPTDGICFMHITACRQCRINVTIQALELPHCGGTYSPGSCIPGCDHLLMYEMSGDIEATTRIITWDTVPSAFTYTTESRSLYIKHCSSYKTNGKTKIFKLEYKILEKLIHVHGSPGEIQYLNSPIFPQPYRVSGDIYNYLLTCTEGYIMLTFDDWSFASESTMMIYYGKNASGNMIQKKADDTRPFVISDKHKSLFITFSTGDSILYDYPYFGFRAKIEFFYNQPRKPISDKGNYYHSLYGGYFSFLCGFYDDVHDSIWVMTRIQNRNYPSIKMRVEYAVLNAEDTIEVRKGNTSTAEVLTTDKNSVQKQTFISDTGIYLRVKERCAYNTKLEVVFASFAQSMYNSIGESKKCPDSSQLLCKNGYCIAKTLACDGHDHCGDNTDEFNCGTISTPGYCDSTKLCQNGNFYCYSTQHCNGIWDCTDGTDEQNCTDDKGAEAETPYQWGTILPVVLICVVLSIIACIMVGYYTRKRRQNQRRQTRMRAPAAMTINNMASEGGAHTDREWMYRDAPPSYDEAMRYMPQQGLVNMGYARTDSTDYLAQPPPYSTTVDDRLPICYIPTSSSVPPVPPVRQSAVLPPGGVHTSNSARPHSSPFRLARNPEPLTGPMSGQGALSSSPVMFGTPPGTAQSQQRRQHSRPSPEVPAPQQEGGITSTSAQPSTTNQGTERRCPTGAHPVEDSPPPVSNKPPNEGSVVDRDDDKDAVPDPFKTAQMVVNSVFDALQDERGGNSSGGGDVATSSSTSAASQDQHQPETPQDPPSSGQVSYAPNTGVTISSDTGPSHAQHSPPDLILNDRSNGQNTQSQPHRDHDSQSQQTSNADAAELDQPDASFV